MLILKTLTRAPNHGYGIAQYIQRISGDALRVGEGSLYPALQRLMIHKWVDAEWALSESGRRVRLYTLTAAGRNQLASEENEFGLTIAGIFRVMEGA
jgi:transcriptional regulator